MSDRPGFLFMFGIYGTRASRETVALLRDTGACGVLLLGRNIESPRQTRRLVDELQDRVGRPLLFAVDHEGGWVLRFKRGITAFPGNAALGRAGDPQVAYATGRHMALELKALGIRLNLAPVVDVLANRYNPGIGIRSFGKDPALAGRLGAAMIRGLQDHGVSACAKHFPGKGAATQDAHVALPVIRLPARDFYKNHLAPFADAVRAKVDCIMTSHVRFPALDRSGATATFSPEITGRLLRRKLKFSGVVLSDDLCMGAVTRQFPIQQAAVSALEAGHDILLIAHEPPTQREACELLEGAVAQGLVPPSRIAASARRIRALMAGRHRTPDDARQPTGGSALAHHIARQAVRLVRMGGVPLPLPLSPSGSAGRETAIKSDSGVGGAKPPHLFPLPEERTKGKGTGGSSAGGNPARRVAAIWPDFREVQDRFTFEGGAEGPLGHLRRRLSRWPARVDVVLAPILAHGPKARAAAARAKAADIAVMFCFEAMRFPGQAETLKCLQRRRCDHLAVCLIRNPWDISLIRPGVTVLDSGGYRECSIDALLDALFPTALRIAAHGRTLLGSSIMANRISAGL